VRLRCHTLGHLIKDCPKSQRLEGPGIFTRPVLLRLIHLGASKVPVPFPVSKDLCSGQLQRDLQTQEEGRRAES